MQNDPSSLNQQCQLFTCLTSPKPSAVGHHADSSSDGDDENKKKTITTAENEEESIDTSENDVDYSVLNDESIQDFS
ncbi:unnamed protein product, partial [Rotaria magnacalcarata]